MPMPTSSFPGHLTPSAPAPSSAPAATPAAASLQGDSGHLHSVPQEKNCSPPLTPLSAVSAPVTPVPTVVKVAQGMPQQSIQPLVHYQRQPMQFQVQVRVASPSGDAIKRSSSGPAGARPVYVLSPGVPGQWPASARGSPPRVQVERRVSAQEPAQTRVVHSGVATSTVPGHSNNPGRYGRFVPVSQPVAGQRIVRIASASAGSTSVFAGSVPSTDSTLAATVAGTVA